ncbi:MAG: AmmeMemoRadiSam system radical SAM enzyme [Bacillota bacterium]
MKEARFWEKAGDGRVRCFLCPHHCYLGPGQRGICQVRKNVDGTLYTLNYAQVSSYALDPTEKKPLYHFFPGSYLFSLGTLGCNLSCGFCQNWTISQEEAPTVEISPQRAVELTLSARARDPRVVGLAYTYNEPGIWFEYVAETAQIAKQQGLVNCLVTNGFIEEAPLRELLQLVDAMNVDVKAFRPEFYRKVCKGDRDPVLRTVEVAHRAGCHVEVTNLLIPGYNDSEAEIGDLVTWLAGISPAIPLHFSRYFPNYRFTEPPTPLTTLEKAAEIARRKLRYVYMGNVWGRGSDTACPECGQVVLRRRGLELASASLRDHRCPRCGYELTIRGDVFPP